MNQKKLIGGAAVAAVVAVLLVAFVVTRNSDSTSDLATEATAATTTTDAPTTTLARTVGDSELVGSTPEATEPSPKKFDPGATSASSPDFLILAPEALATVTTTVAEAGDQTAADGTTATEASDSAEAAAPAPKGPAPVTISRPACAAGLGAPQSQRAPFTGLNASIPSGMPAVVVKVSNNSSASRRALIGLDKADIVFEERIEASATRFFSVFHSQLPPNVGPVRSGRTTDIQITQNLNRPVFAYSGSNQGVARQIKFAADNGILTPFINTDRAPFARDSRYRAPDNLFVDPASLGACGGKGNPTAVFSYGGKTGSSKPASSVSLQARSPYRFDWNGSGWARSQSGSAHVTREGARLAPKNVVVLFVPYVPSQIDSASVDAETIGSGEAWVFRDGTVTTGAWRRNKGHEAYTLTDAGGTKVNLAAGQTWVVLAPAGSASYN